MFVGGGAKPTAAALSLLLLAGLTATASSEGASTRGRRPAPA